MEAEQQKEWMALTAAAERELLHGEWKLRLTEFPSFTNPVVFGLSTASKEIVRDRKLGNETFVVARWRSWQKDVDFEKLKTPVARLSHPRQLVPTVTSREVIFERTRQEELVSELARISIPAYPVPRAIGLDGTSYSLHLDSGFHASTFKWWCNEPSEWRPLVEWYARARRTIESAFPDPAQLNEEIKTPS